MKRAFFALCCVLVFAYVRAEIGAEQKCNGIYNVAVHEWHATEPYAHYYHGGVDVYWTFAGTEDQSSRPYVPAYSGGALLLDPVQFSYSNTEGLLEKSATEDWTLTRRGYYRFPEVNGKAARRSRMVEGL